MWYVTPEPKAEPCDRLIDLIAECGGDQRGQLADGSARNWHRIVVQYPGGGWSFDLERRTVARKDGGWTTTLEGFRSRLAGVEPAVNVQWVAQYLAGVRTVYKFACSLSAPESNLDLVNAIVDDFRNEGPSGLLYAENEGWSGDHGHLTWEFSDTVTGPWWATINRDDHWATFQMELGNRGHRRAFRAGEAPRGLNVYRR
jgi:hypothetical protein